MNVLIVTQYFWPESFGINALARALTENGINTTVLSGQPNYPEGRTFPGYSAWRVAREFHEGVEIIRVPLFPRGSESLVKLAANYLSFVLSGLVVAPFLLRRRKFDLVFVYAPSPLVQTIPAILLSWLKRAPLALWVQDLWPESLSATGFVKSRPLIRSVEMVVRWIYRHTDRVLVPSTAFRVPIERLGVESARIVHLPNPYIVPPAVAPLPDSTRELALEVARGFSVVFAGNLGAAQALESVVDAAEILQSKGQSAVIYLVGSGRLSSWLSREIERRGLTNLRLPGRLPPEQMPAIYESASALLVTLRDEPIFALTIPSKVQGYLAAGRPVIAGLNGEGARVVIESGGGIACPAGDGAALADAIERISGMSADERRDIGENGKRYALERYSLDRVTKEMIGQFEGLFASKKGGHA